MGTSALSGCPLWCPQRKGQDDTQVLIPTLPPPAGTAGPGTPLLSTSSLLGGALRYTEFPHSCVTRPGEKQGYCSCPRANTFTPQQIWGCLSGSPPSRVLCAAPHTLGAPSCPRTLVPARFSQPQARAPVLRQHVPGQRGNRPNSSHFTLAVMAAEGTSLEPSLYPRTDLTPVSHEQPGHRDPQQCSPCPPPSLAL